MVGGHGRTHLTVNPIGEQVDELGLRSSDRGPKAQPSRDPKRVMSVYRPPQAATTRHVAPGVESIYYLGT